jgi:hypothetical protein
MKAENENSVCVCMCVHMYGASEQARGEERREMDVYIFFLLCLCLSENSFISPSSFQIFLVLSSLFGAQAASRAMRRRVGEEKKRRKIEEFSFYSMRSKIFIHYSQR